MIDPKLLFFKKKFLSGEKGHFGLIFGPKSVTSQYLYNCSKNCWMQYLKEEVKYEVEYFHEDMYLKKIPIFLQYLQKMLWERKLLFCLQVFIKIFHKLILSL